MAHENLDTINREIFKLRPRGESDAFFRTKEEKRYDRATQAACVLETQLKKIDNYIQILKEQKNNASHDRLNISIKTTDGVKKYSEFGLIHEKIAILTKIKDDLNNKISIIAANPSDKNIWDKNNVKITEDQAAILNHSRHNGFANFVADVARLAYGALATLWLVANIGIAIVIGCMSPSLFCSNSSSSNCGVDFLTLGFASYAQRRSNNYGQFFSSGDTSSYTLASDAVDALSALKNSYLALTPSS